MRGEAQRRVVQAERLEILPGGELFLPAEEPRQARHQQQHVRLLDHAQALQGVEADAGIGRRVVGLEGGHVGRLKQVEGVVLAVAPRLRVARQLQLAGELTPLPELPAAQPQARVLLRVAPGERRGGAAGELKVAPYHAVGVEVVAGDAAVLVRALAEEQVDAVRRGRHAAGPEARRLAEHLRAAAEEEVPVLRPVHVLPGGVGDVGGDVDLAAADVPALALLAAVERHHPGVARAGGVHFFCVRAGGGQRADAEIQQLPRRFGVREQREGQDEHLRVPEAAALVARVRQPARAHAHRAVPRREVGQQLVYHPAERALALLVALDAHGAVFPAAGELLAGALEGRAVARGGLEGADARIRVAARAHLADGVERAALAPLAERIADLQPRPACRKALARPVRAERAEHLHDLAVLLHLVVGDGGIADIPVEREAELSVALELGAHIEPLWLVHGEHAPLRHAGGPARGGDGVVQPQLAGVEVQAAPHLGAEPRLFPAQRYLQPGAGQGDEVGELRVPGEPVEDAGDEKPGVQRPRLGPEQRAAPQAHAPVAGEKHALQEAVAERARGAHRARAEPDVIPHGRRPPARISARGRQSPRRWRSARRWRTPPCARPRSRR